MKSGLWILILVLIAGVFVGYALRDRIKPPAPADEQAQLKEMGEISDPEAKILRLEAFITDHAESEAKPQAYSMIAREMLVTLKDTTRFVEFARQAIGEEKDPESKGLMYYRLYDLEADDKPEEAALIGTQLLKEQVDASWVYNYIGYDLAQRGRDLDLALALCGKAVELAKDARDSSAALDSRGFSYYRKGMYEESVADLERAVRLVGEPDEEITNHLADAYLAEGETGKAFDSFRLVLVTGENPHARETIDSLMTAEGYSPARRERFEESLWQERMDRSKPAIAFTMPTLEGSEFTFEPGSGEVVVLNFMSPT
jgi:tetratricopeptide (TPR) repeat protein